jgi:CDP-glucose 4,6-dehydratase
MESVVIDRGFWRDRRVLITGHTGFKGAWAALLLRSLDAEVFGFALAPEDPRGVFTVAGVERDIAHRIGDLRDAEAIAGGVEEARPEIILHMAAQALVRRSYAEPVATYATNVMGTVHLLEAVRRAPSVRAVVIVTSDKCYENSGSLWGYRETEALGGHDPYSNSKACAELVTDAYRKSFFALPGAAAIASARAGNVIGGGDWAEGRLTPDAIKAFLAGAPLKIRNPSAVRPWQHVLDPVLGYLLLAERLCAEDPHTQAGWNFGPLLSNDVPVAVMADTLVRLWGSGARWERDGGEHPHEASQLRLDSTKAMTKLGWRPRLDLDEALRLTVDWYQAFQKGGDMRAVALAQIERVLGAEHRRIVNYSRSARGR